MESPDDKSKMSDDFDRALDAALAKHASVEPRAGLEQRILANLRTAEVRAGHRTWIWGFGAAIAAVIVVTGAIAWRSSTPRHAPLAGHPPTAQQMPAQVANHIQNTVPPRKRVSRPRIGRRAQQETTVANPKLDVFPSPLPLSEQEKLLAIYVGQFPEHAALIAEARMADLRHEAEEQQAIAREEQDQKQ